MSNNLPLSSTNPPLYAFLDSCLYDKGMANIPQSLKDQMIQDLADRMQQWLMQSVLQYLPEESVPEMERLLADASSQEAVMDFVQKKIPNAAEIFKDEMVKFKQAYLGK